ncbi:hypothetical protein AU381_21560 [Sinorhizobium glycinis]|uniref:DUF2157 domain-containing protein n=1 Tax=Sinorhizobium glycinis TaxID=1472378 RepID=A0A178XUX4_9HYPH|nr:hypothetical protein AU381_21560 [Sinorhizobium glycinis]
MSPHQVRDLEAYLLERGIGTGGHDAALRRDEPAEMPAEDCEQPRFLRGFHDILITIGVVVVLVGLWGIGGAITMLPAILVLAEILIRRQRLALPAVSLSLALICCVAIVARGVVIAWEETWEPLTRGLIFVCAFPLPLCLFYWRYRVPLSLALLLLSLAATAVIFVLFLLKKMWGIDPGLEIYPHLLSSIVLVAALAVFGVALRYDISDPRRLTPRSDTAFWLHMAAAPALLYAMLGFITFAGGDEIWLSGERGVGQAVAVLLLVAFLMAIGVVIDRRAFVTSGLLSLGGAIWAIVSKTGVSFDTYVFVVFAVVGVTVLAIGIFWQALRRMAMRLLPEAITARLHATQ